MEQLALEGIGVNTITLDRQTDRQPQTLDEKIEKAKSVLKLAAEMSRIYYGEPLIITYSGGKDSDVLLWLAKSCLDKKEFEVLNAHTTVDAPETVKHIKEVFAKLEEQGIKTYIDYHKKADGTNKTMWSLIIERPLPPTRVVRYCCDELKETTSPHRMCAVGVRAAESKNREGRDSFVIRGANKKNTTYYSMSHVAEVHKEAQEIQDEAWDCTFVKAMKKHKDTVVNPIYEWEDADIWEYIHKNNIPVNPLYARGYERVGCIGCPLAKYEQRVKEFKDYPKYKQMYINAFNLMLKAHPEKHPDWYDGQDVFDWWMQEYRKIPKGQLSLFEDNEP